MIMTDSAYHCAHVHVYVLVPGVNAARLKKVLFYLSPRSNVAGIPAHCSYCHFLMDMAGEPCDHQKVSKNLACRRQVFRLRSNAAWIVCV